MACWMYFPLQSGVNERQMSQREQPAGGTLQESPNKLKLVDFEEMINPQGYPCRVSIHVHEENCGPIDCSS